MILKIHMDSKKLVYFGAEFETNVVFDLSNTDLDHAVG